MVLQNQKIENSLKIETQQNKLFLLSIVLILVLFTVVFVVQFLVYRHKKEKLKTAYLTETRISKKVHDELANDVFSTMTFALTQNLANDRQKEILINSLDNVYVRTRDISRENNEIGPMTVFQKI